jgi:DNA-binding GntR family transcriptional regulator
MSTTWLSPALATLEPRLLQRINLPDEIISYAEAATGRRAHLYRERVFARLASREEVETLILDNPAAVLVAYHTYFDTQGDVLSYELSVYPPDRVRYEDEVILDTSSGDS